MAQLKVIADKLNKRSTIPSSLPDDAHITGVVYRNYSFEGQLAGSNQLGDWYKDRDEHYYWGKALFVGTAFSDASTTSKRSASVSPADLPLNQHQCMECAAWMKLHFEEDILKILQGTPFEPALLYAIACQETAIYWYQWMNDHTAEEILARCVFDASGDANGTREAFPKNTADFTNRFGETLTQTLIGEANATRSWRGWGPKQWVYAGYGIFQYDIQAILSDLDFFEQKQWYQMTHCLERVLKELSAKWAGHAGDLFETVKAYNGSGESATNYASNVFQFLEWIKSE